MNCLNAAYCRTIIPFQYLINYIIDVPSPLKMTQNAFKTAGRSIQTVLTHYPTFFTVLILSTTHHRRLTECLTDPLPIDFVFSRSIRITFTTSLYGRCRNISRLRLRLLRFINRSDYQADVCWQISNAIKQTSVGKSQIL